MPNILAFAMLLLWPVVTAVLWHRLPPGRALLATLIAGYLFLPPLPAALDLPVIPLLGKDTLPAVCSFFMALFMRREGLKLLPESIPARALIFLYVSAPVFTVLTNSEPLVWGPLYLPGMNMREAVSAVMAHWINILPMLLARHFLSGLNDQRDFLGALVIGALVYSLPVLVELRLSPQMNIWVYGYFQHLFEQMVRGSGYRPLVFLYHALWLAFYLMTAIVAAAALARQAQGGTRVKLWLVTGFLFAVLFLCKSYASLFYTVALVPLVMVVRAGLQIRLALVMAVIALVYPMAKANQLVPEAQIVALAGRMGEDRAHTLKFRFDNETVLTTRAMQKPLFGWGLWGRQHIYDTTDGKILTITDGRWVIVLGVLGFVGFLAEFGLLALPIFMLWWRSRATPSDGESALANHYAAPIALLLGVNMFDLIPNATLTQLSWLAAGVLIGHVEQANTRQSEAPLAGPARPAPFRIRTVI